MPSIQVVVGAQWGDEGKGKIVDMLSKECDVICRCQGGNNAGHTVVVDGVYYFFHLVPSGIIQKDTMCIIGNGVVLHLADLFKEIDELKSKKIENIENRMRVSCRSHIVFDIHRQVDELEESARGTSLIGTTKRGIGPTYSSKVSRRGLRVGDLVGDWEVFCERYKILVEFYKTQYPALKTDVEATLAELKTYRERMKPMVRDTVLLLHNLSSIPSHHILIECAQSTMLDIDFGTYPFVTSSNCAVGGVCTGLGIPPSRIGDVYGVVKAYTTRVGSGPFPSELHGERAEHLQAVGREFGVTTGRKRRVGWLDAVVIRYSHMLNNFMAIALTKMDILDQFDEIKIAVDYKDPKTGAILPSLPADMNVLGEVEVVYETFPGWKTPITNIRQYSELPDEAKKYIAAVEKYCQVPVRWIGVGEGRQDIITKNT